jgi:hypothetical protein
MTGPASHLGLAHVPGVRLIQVGDEEGVQVHPRHAHHRFDLKLTSFYKRKHCQRSKNTK